MSVFTDSLDESVGAINTEKKGIIEEKIVGAKNKRLAELSASITQANNRLEELLDFGALSNKSVGELNKMDADNWVSKYVRTLEWRGNIQATLNRETAAFDALFGE